MSFTQETHATQDAARFALPATAPTARTAATAFAELERTWNEADGAAFGAVFTEDCDFVDVRGEHHHGRSAVAAGHQGIFDSIYRGSTVRYTVDFAREIAPSVVLTGVAGILAVPSGPMAGVHHARITAVLTEDSGTWSVAAFHNTLVQGQR